MDNKTTERNWSQRPISGSVGNVPTFGINSVTIHDGNPYFFLFSDVDTKQLESLKSVLKVYKHRNLSVYFYETTKGWHVISPVLLGLGKWIGLTNMLRPMLNDYSFDTIRYTSRQTDGKKLYFENWNWKELESYDLHYQLRYKFQCGFDKIEKHWVSTKLQWSTYNQLRITKKCHYQCNTKVPHGVSGSDL
ncbi:MAG: hypothetical protein IIA19_09555 [Thaumarchaeota archaeon]|nr:hypothetical protein [Nitrososphaerota archaeon]